MLIIKQIVDTNYIYIQIINFLIFTKSDYKYHNHYVAKVNNKSYVYFVAILLQYIESKGFFYYTFLIMLFFTLHQYISLMDWASFFIGCGRESNKLRKR